MDYFIFGEFMSCFIDFIDINLLEKYTLTNLVSRDDRLSLSDYRKTRNRKAYCLCEEDEYAMGQLQQGKQEG